MPAATHLHAAGKTADLRELYLKWSKITYSLALLGGLYLLVFGPRFIGWWVGPTFEQPSGDILRILTVSFLVFLPMRGVAQPMLMGMGKPRRPTIAFLAAGVLNLVLSLALARPFGLNGVAWGTAIPNIAFASALLIFACRDIGVPVETFVPYVFGRATIGGAVVLAALLAIDYTSEPSTLLGLSLAGVSCVALFALVWIGFVYRDDPRLDLLAVLRLRRAPI
jgi:O-antigen/teichoic acid export membrane protein